MLSEREIERSLVREGGVWSGGGSSVIRERERERG